MRISFIGDVMIGRMIGSKYRKAPYQLIEEDILTIISHSDFSIANLESPLAINSKTEGDHLQFAGNPSLLREFKEISLFSTANNHITDCGEIGIDDTLEELDNNAFLHNGVFEKEYKPYKDEIKGQKIALITLTDMLNIPFSENSKYNVLRLGDKSIAKIIKYLKTEGYFVIIFAHVGMLFTRYPNPVTRNHLHGYIDAGADLIVSTHSHCLGGMEKYKEKYIFHSLGDFCMDGNSFRRRKAGILNITIQDNSVLNWEIIPTIVSDNFVIKYPDKKIRDKMLKSFKKVSVDIENHNYDYIRFFKKAYRKEILNHSLSTIAFLYHQRGLKGLCKMISMRATEVLRTVLWMITDRSKDQRDDDAIKADRKKISQEELFGK